MRVADINVGDRVLIPYMTRAVRSIPGRLNGQCISHAVPRVRGWYPVKVLNVLPKGRVLVAEEYTTYDQPDEDVVKNFGFAAWFFHMKKTIVTHVREFEVASRSVRSFN